MTTGWEWANLAVMRDVTARRLSTFHTALYRASRGRFGTRLVNNDMLLLTTTGRLSGRSHTVPLLYLRDGESYVVIASWGGRDTPPHWYSNLKADPAVEVQVGGRRVPALATEADTTTRHEWWPRVVEAYDGYLTYQSRTERMIPVVFLEPIAT